MKFKLFAVLALATTVLTACGGFEEGDKLTLKSSVEGSDTIHSWQEAVDEAKEDGTFDVDGVTINSMFKGYEVKVVEVSKKDQMILVELLEGSDEGTMWWVPEPALRDATE